MNERAEPLPASRRASEIVLLAVAAAIVGLAAALMGAPVLLIGLTLVVFGLVFAYPRDAAIPVALLTPVANLAVLRVPGVIDVRMHEVLWVVLITSLLLRAVVRRPLPLVLPPRWVTWSLAGLAAWQLVSALANHGGIRSIVEVAQLGYYSVVLWLLAAIVPTIPRERLRTILRALGVAWVVLVVASLAYFAFRLQVPVRITYSLGGEMVFKPMNLKVTESGDLGLDVLRMGMFGLAAVSTASVLSGLPAAMLAFALTARKATDRLLSWILFVLFGICLVLTFSRVGWVAGLLTVLVVLWRRGKGESLWAFLGIAAVILVLLATPQISARLEDFTNPAEGSTKSHLKLWQRAIGYANDQPVFGGGPYSFSAKSINAITGEPLPVHNFVFEAAAETGWVGAAFAVAFVAAMLLWGWRRLAHAPPVIFSLWLGVGATVLMALSMNGFREDTLWVWAGLMFAAGAFTADGETSAAA